MVGLVGALEVAVRAPACRRSAPALGAGRRDGHRVGQQALGGIVDPRARLPEVGVDQIVEASTTGVVALAGAAVWQEVGVGSELGEQQVLRVALEGLGGAGEGDNLEVGELGRIGIAEVVAAAIEISFADGGEGIGEVGIDYGQVGMRGVLIFGLIRFKILNVNRLNDLLYVRMQVRLTI